MNENSESIEPAGFDISDAKPIREIDVADVAALGDAIIDDAPEVSAEAAERVVSGEMGEGEEARPESAPRPNVGFGGASGPVDKYGQPFDPEKHKTRADGSPDVSDRTGLLKLKPGNANRKPSSGGKPKHHSKVYTPGDQVNPETGLSPAQEQQARVTGKVAASLLVNVSMMVGGQDFAPRRDPAQNFDELAVLESGFADYFIATGKTDLPPGVALCTVVAMYMLPRFTMPTTQTRVKSIGAKIYGWWQDRKLRKQRKKEGKANGTLSDTGNDGKRENDAREKIEPSL